MSHHYRFNRLELAGSLGDLGTLLPLAIGLILINKLDPTGVFWAVGLFFILSGVYFGLTVPVQPMKVISAYAIATSMSASQITASGLLIGLVLLIIGITGIITVIGRLIPLAVVRGVQLSTGTMLMVQGVKFMLGVSTLQLMQNAVEPFLTIQSIGPLPIGLLIGVAGGILTLLFLDSRRFPAGLLVILAGLILGLTFGTRLGWAEMKIGLYLPSVLPHGWPTAPDFSFALIALVLPQIPMTVGNAVVAYADLSEEYFGSQSSKVTYRASCISMALANCFSVFIGGMPLCHGAGGLAAHYRFGARTAGSNLIIGAVFVLIALSLGPHALAVIYLMPLSILGILLLFAGIQLAMTIKDMTSRRDLFVCAVMLGVTLATNLAAGFLVGIAVAFLLKIEKLSV